MKMRKCFLISLLVALVSSSAPAPASAAPSDPPSGYYLQETITVPSNGSVAQAVGRMEPGQAYKIRAVGSAPICVASSGYCGVGGYSYTKADAEYAFDPSNAAAPPRDGVCSGDATDVGISINGASPNWGAYSATHKYLVSYVPASTLPLSFRYVDCDYSDNSGSLTVYVFIAKPATTTAPFYSGQMSPGPGTEKAGPTAHQYGATISGQCLPNGSLYFIEYRDSSGVTYRTTSAYGACNLTTTHNSSHYVTVYCGIQQDFNLGPFSVAVQCSDTYAYDEITV
jgi:hypothetical protein